MPGRPQMGQGAELGVRPGATTPRLTLPGVSERGAHQEFGDMPAACVMDAGNNGVIILADKMLPPRKHGVLIPGPQAHAMKLAFEKYFLWKARHGYVSLP